MDVNIEIKALRPLSVTIEKKNTTQDSPERKTAPHIHSLCEIYINLTGNVSFVVEKNVYTIRSGDIILSRPYEYHHCIYHDNSDHQHYLIVFSVTENPELFQSILNPKKTMHNHIRLSGDKLDRFLKLCEELLRKDTGYTTILASFFQLIACMDDGIASHTLTDTSANIPADLRKILDYIDDHYNTINTVNEIASTLHLSLSTLERHFKIYLSTTPKRYLEDKKLQKACILLREHYSVTEACFESGFTDYSHFIAVFKKRFHTTPLKYQKMQ